MGRVEMFLREGWEGGGRGGVFCQMGVVKDASCVHRVYSGHR